MLKKITRGTSQNPWAGFVELQSDFAITAPRVRAQLEMFAEKLDIIQFIYSVLKKGKSLQFSMTVHVLTIHKLSTNNAIAAEFQAN